MYGAGCSIYNGYIYCVAGSSVYYAPVSSTGVGAWQATTSYPTSPYYGGLENAGCSIYNGYIYCAGGTGSSPFGLVYYAPVSSTGVGAWQATQSLPVYLGNAGCFIYNSYIYCVGAAGSQSSPSNLVYYEAVSSTGIMSKWQATTSYPVDISSPGSDGAGCSIYNGYIYCVGSDTSPYNQVYYAPVSSTGVGAWQATTRYPALMYDEGCSIYNGYIYCVGTPASTSNLVYYAPVSSTGVGAWQATTSYPVEMYDAYCEIPGSGGGYFGGGGPSTGPWAQVTSCKYSSSTGCSKIIGCVTHYYNTTYYSSTNCTGIINVTNSIAGIPSGCSAGCYEAGTTCCK